MTAIISPVAISPTDAISLLDTANMPVIFWDTCGLVDILRLPIRNYNSSILPQIVSLKDKIDTGSIISIASEMSIKEWNDNADPTIDEVKKYIKKRSNEYLEVLRFINETSIFSQVPEVNLQTYNLEQILQQLALSIVNNTHFVNHSFYSGLAVNRVADKLSPAENKSEVKDCIVWETCLDLRTKMADKSKKFIFHSSNTKDFCQAGTSTLAPLLLSESLSIQLDFTFKLNMLHHTITT